MKNQIRIALLTLVVVASIWTPSFAKESGNKSPQASLAPLGVGMTRLQELRSMDVKSMTRQEKKEVRRELRSLQKAEMVSGGGIYLSAGAVILIIVLLIIFL